MKRKYVKLVNGRFEVAPGDMYGAAIEEVVAILTNEVGVRRNQRWIIDRFEALPEHALELAHVPFGEVEELSDEDRALRQTTLGLLRKYFVGELAHEAGVESVNLLIHRDDAWRE